MLTMAVTSTDYRIQTPWALALELAGTYTVNLQ